VVTPSVAIRYAIFQALAVSNRERAEKTSNATMPESYLRLAFGYEVLAKGFPELSQRQLANDRATSIRTANAP